MMRRFNDSSTGWHSGTRQMLFPQVSVPPSCVHLTLALGLSLPAYLNHLSRQPCPASKSRSRCLSVSQGVGDEGRMAVRKRWLRAVAWLVLIPIASGTVGLAPAIAQPSAPTSPLTTQPAAPRLASKSTPPRTRSTCPTELEPLINQLLPALPSYVNRVIQRSRRSLTQASRYGSVVLAGQPDFSPLPLPDAVLHRDRAVLPNAPKLATPMRQVFFTTLERQYGKQYQPDGLILLQQYHWLVLAPSDQGWQLVQLLTRSGAYPTKTNSSPTPPRDASHGFIAQGIQTWLRDCQAGVLP